MNFSICPAKSFDIPMIMKIERASFIPEIQESQKTFEERLRVFPEGFFVLCIDGSVAGYFCSEKWQTIPKSDGALTLGHSASQIHKNDGIFLYVSSYAILPEYRNLKLGKPFFERSLRTICTADKKIKKVILLVNEEWKGAKHIYETLGFKEERRIESFFPSLEGGNSAGILMSADTFGGDFERNSMEEFL